MESEAIDAFFAHVASFASAPVYWPNISDDIQGPPAGDHFRVSVFPVSPEEVNVCGGSRYTWILQVSAYVRDGVGPSKPAQYADEIRSGIPALTTLTSDNFTFQTSSPCTVIPALKSDGWYITPVQCRFISID